MAGANEMGGVLMPMHMDQSDFNGHEVMANLTAVINHMVDAEIMVLHKGVRPVSSVLYFSPFLFSSPPPFIFLFYPVFPLNYSLSFILKIWIFSSLRIYILILSICQSFCLSLSSCSFFFVSFSHCVNLNTILT